MGPNSTLGSTAALCAFMCVCILYTLETLMDGDGPSPLPVACALFVIFIIITLWRGLALLRRIDDNAAGPPGFSPLLQLWYVCTSWTLEKRDEKKQKLFLCVSLFFFILFVFPSARLGPYIRFVAYKHPASKSYVYRSSSSSSLPSSEGQWNESSFPIDSPDSLPGRTLQPLYSDVQLPSDRIGRNRFVLMYNDELPNGTTSGELHAHAKGVVAFDWTYQTGFWMIHSVPRFPPAPDGPSSRYAFPPSGLIYGQTMICVTLPLHQADLVGEMEIYYPAFSLSPTAVFFKCSLQPSAQLHIFFLSTLISAVLIFYPPLADPALMIRLLALLWRNMHLHLLFCIM